MDPISERRLSEVHPRLAALIRQLDVQHAREFPDNVLRVTQGLRTWDEQSWLYSQGRTMPGSIVTNAPAGHSMHEFGLAVDLVPLVGGRPDWDHTHANWQRMIEIGVELGLTSGSCWQSIKDWPHLQLQGSLPVSPDDAMRSAFASGGLEAVWALGGIPSVVPDPDSPVAA